MLLSSLPKMDPQKAFPDKGNCAEEFFNSALNIPQKAFPVEGKFWNLRHGKRKISKHMLKW